MTARINFTVPMCPPSANHCYGTRKPSRGNYRMRYLKPEGKRFKQATALIARATANAQGWRYDGGEIGLDIAVYFPDKRRRDAANCEKLTTDAIAEALGFDDRRAHVSTHPAGVDKDHPRAEITVWLITNN